MFVVGNFCVCLSVHIYIDLCTYVGGLYLQIVPNFVIYKITITLKSYNPIFNLTLSFLNAQGTIF